MFFGARYFFTYGGLLISIILFIYDIDVFMKKTRYLIYKNNNWERDIEIPPFKRYWDKQIDLIV